MLTVDITLRKSPPNLPDMHGTDYVILGLLLWLLVWLPLSLLGINVCVLKLAQAPVSCSLCGEVFIIESLPRRSQVAGGGVIAGPLARLLIWRT